MPNFRKKPVVIEARRVPNGGDASEIAKWCNGVVFIDRIELHTLEGTMNAKPGDWIIKGVKGEFYSCKDNIFKLTYEEVDETSSSE